MEVLQYINQLKLPELNLQNGSMSLLIFVFLWINTFYFNQQLTNIMMKIFNVKYWESTKQNQKLEYVSTINAFIHAIISFNLAMIAIFCSCEDLSQNIFNNEQCLQNPQNKVIYVQLFSAGFLIVDAFIMLQIQNYSSLNLQLYIHHALGLIGIAFGIFFKGIVLQLTLIQLTSELSAIFTNFRYFLKFHNMENGQINLINGILLIISFFFTRIVLITYSIWIILLPYIRFNHGINDVIMYILYFMLYFLNIFWFTKIMKKTFKIILKNKKQ